jgi:hypothetical protein
MYRVSLTPGKPHGYGVTNGSRFGLPRQAGPFFATQDSYSKHLSVLYHHSRMNLPRSYQPQLELRHDASGNITGGVCSNCGVELGSQLARPITEKTLKELFDLHLQARHP